MSEEEISDRMILIINGYKECLDYNCNQTEERQREIKYDIETLETMIDLYNKEKEKNKELEYSLKNNVVTKYCIRHKADDYESKGYIEIAGAMRELLEERN